MMGERLAKGKQYPMLQDEPEYCAGSLLATVAALYEARTDLAAAIARAEAWKQAFTIERQRLYISQGMKIEQARIHAETDAAIAAQQAEGES